MTPKGALARANEPSLLLIPPTASDPNGTLLAVAGGESATDPSMGRALVLKRSSDTGVCIKMGFGCNFGAYYNTFLICTYM